MIVRAKAPLRIGLAGGGTDVSPYSDVYGGAVLNATISMYAYAILEPRPDGKTVIRSIDREEVVVHEAADKLPMDGRLDLVKGACNRLMSLSPHTPHGFELCTYVDAPAGSGLGTSSTLVVAIVGAFVEWLKLPLGDYDIAHLAFDIERNDMAMAGGKQDQYAATFGGYNYIEFHDRDKVVVNPLRIKPDVINELEFNIVLYYTGTSRLSSKIIQAQSENVSREIGDSIEAMHGLKEQSIRMKEAVLKGELDRIGEILDFGWQCKKRTANGVTNPVIDGIYEAALKAGATGGKISGAGGGGFMILYCPGNSRYKVIDSLKRFGGEFRRYQFTPNGLVTWTRL